MTIKRLLCAMAVMLACAPAPAFALLCGALPIDPVTVSASGLAFGNYSGGADVTASVTVNISCAIPVELLPSFTVSISGGNSNNPASRYMNRSGSHLNYSIHMTNGYGSLWGDGLNGTLTKAFNGVLIQLGSTSMTGYGKLPAGQYVTPGLYSDTLTVTVTY